MRNSHKNGERNMRNKVCKAIKCELRHSIFPKQPILEAKIHERSE